MTIHFRHLNIHEDQIIPVITDLFKDTDGTGAEDDDFDLSEALEKAAFVERGDVWTVGRHRLMCGDATIEEDVLKLMDGKKANLILTDPPYGVSFQSSDGLSIQNDSIKGEEFYQFLLASMQNMVSVLEPGGAAYVFHADTEGLNFRRAFVDAGLHLAGCCTMELDEKYASVILRRYVEDGGNPDEVYVERNGQKLMFADLVKQVE